jgi:TonB family protein
VQNVVYAKFQSVSGRLVPFEVVTHYINSKRSVDLRITSLEATSNPPDDSLVVSGATKGKCSGDGHGQVIQGLIVSKVAPVYPPGARMAHVSGTVVLRITIGKTGEIKDVQVALSPRADLSESAVAAVRQYVYKPFLLDGVPVEVIGFITINYVSR